MIPCGIDFGTTNSTAGLGVGGRAALAPLEGGSPILPSAAFFAAGAAPRFGRAAVDAYVAGEEGRLMRSVKSALSTSLIRERTRVGERWIAFEDVIGSILAHVKKRLDEAAGAPVDAVVQGRPVHFVDGDSKGDAEAEATLERILRGLGFRHVAFQYEPIGAALSYEAELNREELTLVADIGGGTSDFSIIRIGPERAGKPDRADDILANDGVRVGGVDFDRRLSLAAIMPELGYETTLDGGRLVMPRHYYQDLATWAKINLLYVHAVERDVAAALRQADEPDKLERLLTALRERLGHALSIAAERAKIDLSGQDRAAIDLSVVEAGLGATLNRDAFAEAIAAETTRIADAISRCFSTAGVAPQSVGSVFLTGGSTLLPAVRAAILTQAPAAKIVEGDKFGSVGLGLTIDATRRFA